MFANREQLRTLLVRFAEEHPGDECEGYPVTVTRLQEVSKMAGAEDLIQELKILHQEGLLYLQKWDWMMHRYEPWQEWADDSFFDNFRLLRQSARRDSLRKSEERAE